MSSLDAIDLDRAEAEPEQPRYSLAVLVHPSRKADRIGKLKARDRSLPVRHS